MIPTIALIGRPNVGKSTIFNRLLRKSKAITHDTPGVTRDRIIGQGSISGVDFTLVDTGGMVLESVAGEENFERAIFEQAREAIHESQALLLVVDGREGLTLLDEQAAEIVRQSGKPVLLLVNKVDGFELEDSATAEFHVLGFEMIPVSASHGYNLNELRERVASIAEAETIAEPEGKPIERGLRLAVLGRPNAGKSSIINAMVGEERLIVSDVPGTTRDSVDVTFDHDGRRFTFVDTAGVRRRTHVKEAVERFSVLRALKSSTKADVTILVLNSMEGVARQDKRLLDYLVSEKIPFIVAVNKIDLVPKSEDKNMREGFERALRIAPHVPVIYTSALNRVGLGKVLPLAAKLMEECATRTTTGELNRAMSAVIEKHQPPLVKRRRAKFYYLTQAERQPPTFVFFVNDTELVRDSYVRYLENQLRKMFRIKIAPLSVVLRASHEKKPKVRKKRVVKRK